MPIGAITAVAAASVVGTARNATVHHDTSDGANITEPVACSGRGGFGDAVLWYDISRRRGLGVEARAIGASFRLCKASGTHTERRQILSILSC